jgi:hypothetical protein
MNRHTLVRASGGGMSEHLCPWCGLPTDLHSRVAIRLNLPARCDYVDGTSHVAHDPPEIRHAPLGPSVAPAAGSTTICVCGHTADQHDPDDGRCWAMVEGPGRFDDGKDGPGLCECLSLRGGES